MSDTQFNFLVEAIVDVWHREIAVQILAAVMGAAVCLAAV